MTNNVFAKNAWYFRNSLVRANYRDVKNGVYEDMSFLEAFLRNLLMGEKNELKNLYMHIRWDKMTHSDDKQHIEQHIKDEDSLLKALDAKEIFLYSLNLTEKITGAGKGRYRFIV